MSAELCCSSGDTHKREHRTPVLFQLHWLPVHFRSLYKILFHTFTVLSGTPPLYLRTLIQKIHFWGPWSLLFTITRLNLLPGRRGVNSIPELMVNSKIDYLKKWKWNWWILNWNWSFLQKINPQINFLIQKKYFFHDNPT